MESQALNKKWILVGGSVTLVVLNKGTIVGLDADGQSRKGDMLMARNKPNCVHHFAEQIYNVYYKDADGLMRDHPEPHMVCTKCGFAQAKALYNLLKDAPVRNDTQENADPMPNILVSSKDERNRSLWEQISEEQVSLIPPLEFSWVINDVNHTTTITEVPAIVGRDKKYANLLIEDQYVARIHARIDLYRNGRGFAFLLTDLGSMNGVKIDGKAVKVSATFKPGQTISFGRVDVIVRQAEAEE